MVCMALRTAILRCSDRGGGIPLPSTHKELRLNTSSGLGALLEEVHSIFSAANSKERQHCFAF